MRIITFVATEHIVKKGKEAKVLVRAALPEKPDPFAVLKLEIVGPAPEGETK